MQDTIHQLAIGEVKQRLESLTQGRPYFAREEYSIHMDVDRSVLLDILRLLRVPARLSENRVVLVMRGKADFTLDMLHFEVKAPCLALLKDKSLLHIRNVSTDFLCHVIAYGERSVLDAEKQTVISISNEEQKDVEQTIRLLWRFCGKAPFPYSVVGPLLESLFEQYALLVKRSARIEEKTPRGRKEEIFRDFLSLLSAHFQEQRELRFYADTLCISVHYLCEAVYAAGGHYPKHYIHQSLISEAKYLLAYTPRSAAAISEELGLPNPAWFSRLFKRETGLTPGEFRKQFRR